MKHTLFLVILFVTVVLLGSTGFAQSGWFTIQTGLPQTNDICFPTADVGYIVGSDGFARKSTDGGMTWLPMHIESDYKGKANFLSISFPTSQVGYISGNEVGGFGIILKTTDAGNSWNKTPYSLSYNINYKIIFPSATVGYITTYFTKDHSNYTYMLMKSNDGGNGWTAIDSSCCNYSIEQMVWKTEDLGLFMSFHLGDPPESYLRYTSDGGNTIQYAYNNAGARIGETTAVGIGDGDVWYIGGDYDLYRSEDTNFKWLPTKGPTSYALQYGTFFIANGSNSYCITKNYPGITIFKTTDNGLNWFNQFDDTTSRSIAGFAPAQQIAFLLASYDSLGTEKWKILKTTDGGGAPLTEVRDHFESNISLLPNPTTGIITVHNTPANITKATVLNLLGERVLEIAHPNSSDFTLDLSKLPAGTYFARFMVGEEVITRKILKE